MTARTPSEGQPEPHPHSEEWEEEMKRRNNEASDLEFHRQLQVGGTVGVVIVCVYIQTRSLHTYT